MISETCSLSVPSILPLRLPCHDFGDLLRHSPLSSPPPPLPAMIKLVHTWGSIYKDAQVRDDAPSEGVLTADVRARIAANRAAALGRRNRLASVLPSEVDVTAAEDGAGGDGAPQNAAEILQEAATQAILS